MKCRFCLVGLKWGLRVCISMPTKVRTVKSMVFPVDVYGCESWIIKEVEDQRIDAFKLWCCGRLLRVSWTARRSNQSILKEINPEYSLEGLMLNRSYNTLTTWCKELTHLKRSDAGKEWGQKEKGLTEDEMVGLNHWLSGHEWANSRKRWRTEKSGVMQSIGLQRARHDLMTQQQ